MAGMYESALEQTADAARPGAWFAYLSRRGVRRGIHGRRRRAPRSPLPSRPSRPVLRHTLWHVDGSYSSVNNHGDVRIYQISDTTVCTAVQDNWVVGYCIDRTKCSYSTGYEYYVNVNRENIRRHVAESVPRCSLHSRSGKRALALEAVYSDRNYYSNSLF